MSLNPLQIFEIAILSSLAFIVFVGTIVTIIRKRKRRSSEFEYSKKIDPTLKEKSKYDFVSVYTPGIKQKQKIYESFMQETVYSPEYYLEQSLPYESGKTYHGETETSRDTFAQEKEALRNRMLKYSEIIKDNRKESEIQDINDSIYSKIMGTQPLRIEKIPYRPGLVFNFDFKNPFYILKGVGVTFTKNEEIFLIASLRKTYPFTLELRKLEETYRGYYKNSEFHSYFGEEYLLQSSIPDACIQVLKEEKIKQLISKLLPRIIRVSISEKSLLALLDKDILMLDFFKLLEVFHERVMLKEKYGQKLEELLCYQCNDPFDVAEDVCDNCGAPRPNCIVCLLDLHPSEKDSVIKMPCCGVYAHEDHILTWLSKNIKCPNCHEDLATLLRDLQKK